MWDTNNGTKHTRPACDWSGAVLVDFRVSWCWKKASLLNINTQRDKSIVVDVKSHGYPLAPYGWPIDRVWHVALKQDDSTCDRLK